MYIKYLIQISFVVSLIFPLYTSAENNFTLIRYSVKAYPEQRANIEEEVRIESHIKISAKNNTKLLISESLIIFDNEIAGKQLREITQEINSKTRAPGEYTNGFSFVLPRGLPNGSYPIKTALHVDGLMVKSNDMTLKIYNQQIEILRTSSENDHVAVDRTLASSEFTSVCMRNLKKVWDVQKSKQMPFYYGVDGVRQALAGLQKKILTPCVASDPVTSTKLNDIISDAEAEISDCLHSGAGKCSSKIDPMNQDSLAQFQSETQRAMENPNYSADLGAIEKVKSMSNVETSESTNQSSDINTQSEVDFTGKRIMDGVNWTFEICKQQAESHPEYEQAMRSLPNDQANILLRGSLIGIDLMIRGYKECDSDPRATEALRQLKIQRDATLNTCKQISAVDNCLLSPFDRKIW